MIASMGTDDEAHLREASHFVALFTDVEMNDGLGVIGQYIQVYIVNAA